MVNKIHIIDDDEALRDSLSLLMQSQGLLAITYENGDVFLEQNLLRITAPVLLDIRMPGKNGIEVLSESLQRNENLKIIMMSGHADIATAVKAVKRGAIDFIEKPFREERLIPLIRTAQNELDEAKLRDQRQRQLLDTIDKLTPREKEVMEMLVDGNPNKIIASNLGLSIRTVETHRAHLMSKLNIKSIPELVKMHLTTK